MSNQLTTAEIVKRVTSGDYAVLDSLSDEERKIIEHILSELKTDGRSSTLQNLWEMDYERMPVSLEQFITDEYYLGSVGVDLYPLWKKELNHVHDPKNEICELVLRGSVGSGKTTAAVISLLYKIHQLICLANPQKHYRLMKGSPIVFGLFNIFKYLASDTSYKYFSTWTKMSPFFRDAMKDALIKEGNIPEWMQKLNKVYHLNSEALSRQLVRFPKNITIALGSQAIHALGQNLFGGLLDEADMGKHKSMSNDEMSQVADLYGQVRTRMESRFMQMGGINPGLLVLVSQVRFRDSFLEQHVKRVSDDPRTHVVSYSIWEMKPHIHPPDEEKFKVVIGDQHTQSRIVDPDDTKPIPETAEVIEVPESLRARFEFSVDDAIRDLAGRSTYGSGLLLPRRDRLFECYATSTQRSHPFSSEKVSISIENDDETNIVEYFIKSTCMSQHDKVTGAWKPRWYPGVDRAVHVDLAKNGDCAGLAMGCIGDVRRIERFDQDGKTYITQDYTIFIDLMLRISAVKGSEIDFSKIRQFIYFLHSIGYPVRWVSYDGWQSVDSQQAMKKAGYETKTLSVDKGVAPYYALRSTIMEGRLDIYEYQPFTDEMTRLQDKSSMKNAKPPIDHIPLGSKDVTDAVCGVSWRLIDEKGILRPSPTDKEIDSRVKTQLSGKSETHLDKIKNKKWVVGERQMKHHLADLFDD